MNASQQKVMQERVRAYLRMRIYFGDLFHLTVGKQALVDREISLRTDADARLVETIQSLDDGAKGRVFKRHDTISGFLLLYRIKDGYMGVRLRAIVANAIIYLKSVSEGRKQHCRLGADMPLDARMCREDPDRRPTHPFGVRSRPT